MTLSIFEIIKLLEIIKLYQKEDVASREYVKNTFNSKPVKFGKLPNYLQIENFCNIIGIIEIDSSIIRINELGNKLLKEFNKENKISEQFQKIIIQEGINKSKYFEMIKNCVSKFEKNDEGTESIKKSQIYDLISTPEVLPLLYELEIFKKNDDFVDFNSKNLYISNKKITQKQLEEQLENQKIIGQIAEEIVVKYEQNRLKNEGMFQESANVKQISQEFANAGYDIESFFKDINEKIEKIFIEVKGSTNENIDFYWSVNEIEKAKELNEKYWIYFVSKIDVKSKISKSEIIKIQNPNKRIFEDSNFHSQVEKYHITRKGLI